MRWPSGVGLSLRVVRKNSCVPNSLSSIAMRLLIGRLADAELLGGSREAATLQGANESTQAIDPVHFHSHQE